MISTELLLKRETDPLKIEVLKRVRQSARNLTEMTDNASKLATLSAGEALECFPGDPVELLRSVLPDLEHRLAAKNMTLVDHSGSGFAASFNPILKEVCANLIANAIKYSPEGTRIDIGVEDQGEGWQLTVRDQGDGVPDEHKQRIFNRFERLGKRGVEGSGLGLTITKQIVTLHGGVIWLENNPMGGSIFFVKVPKSPKAR
jgi:signal transduction histidine kinase